MTTHTRVADLNIPNVQTLDDRRIEVIANGLPLWGGCQIAVDATLVSPLTWKANPDIAMADMQERHCTTLAATKSGSI